MTVISHEGQLETIPWIKDCDRKIQTIARDDLAGHERRNEICQKVQNN